MVCIVREEDSTPSPSETQVEGARARYHRLAKLLKRNTILWNGAF